MVDGNSNNEFKIAYEIYKHTDNNLHNRISYFIIAESMFFIAYATFSTNFIPVTFNILFEMVTILIAIGFTLSWWIASYRLIIRLDFLTENYLLKDENRIYYKYIKSANQQYIETIGNLLPCFTFTGWVSFGFLTIIRFESTNLYWSWLFITILILIIILIIKNKTRV